MFTKLPWCFKNRERWSFSSQKNDKMMFYVVWNTMFADQWKVLVLIFSEISCYLYFNQRVDENMIFTDYKKNLVLNFSEMWNTVSFWTRKLIESWYFLITEKFYFCIFWRWEIRSFFEPKSWWKYDIYLVFMVFCAVLIVFKRSKLVLRA